MSRSFPRSQKRKAKRFAPRKEWKTRRVRSSFGTKRSHQRRNLAVIPVPDRMHKLYHTLVGTPPTFEEACYILLRDRFLRPFVLPEISDKARERYRIRHFLHQHTDHHSPPRNPDKYLHFWSDHRGKDKRGPKYFVAFEEFFGTLDITPKQIVETMRRWWPKTKVDMHSCPDGSPKEVLDWLRRDRLGRSRLFFATLFHAAKVVYGKPRKWEIFQKSGDLKVNLLDFQRQRK